MDNNGNGDLKALIKLKTGYRANIAEIDLQITELQASKKKLRTDYIEEAVDIADRIFPETPKAPAAPAPEPEPESAPEVALYTKPALTKCPECDSKVGPNDKFCSECAYPLKEEKPSEVEGDGILGTAGRQRRTRRRP
jgi:hypothetical protein